MNKTKYFKFEIELHRGTITLEKFIEHALALTYTSIRPNADIDSKILIYKDKETFVKDQVLKHDTQSLMEKIDEIKIDFLDQKIWNNNYGIALSITSNTDNEFIITSSVSNFKKNKIAFYGQNLTNDNVEYISKHLYRIGYINFLKYAINENLSNNA